MLDRRFRTLLVAVVAGLLCPLLLVDSATVAAVPPGDVRTDHQLREALGDIVAAGASGAVLRVDHQRDTNTYVAGAARLDPRVAMRQGAKLRVGSVTKTFVATLVLQAAAEKRLRLDDTVERWLPGLVPDGDRITLRQLLNHTSGLFDLVRDQDFFRAVLTDPLREYTPVQLVRIATAHPPVFEPGTDWGYSNTGYVLLGLVLERATGRSVSALVRDRITGPLKLEQTYLPVRSPDIPGFHAHGYLPPSLTGAGYVDITRISPTALGSAGALVSTAGDLRRFFRALLGGRLLPPAQLAQMQTTVEARPGYEYGLGLYSQQTPCGRVWGNDGNAPGYETFAWNNHTGRQGFVLNVTTQPDDAIETAQNAATDAAACQILTKPGN
ncbi:MAG: serine hydrolase domain-containing protein [Nocardioides sp.]